MDNILVAIDGSKQSNKTIGEAAKVAGKFKAKLTVLYVIEENHQLGYDIFAAHKKAEAQMKDKANDILGKAAKAISDKGVEVKTRLEKGHASDIICDIAEKEKYDLVVIGSRGLSGIGGMLLGSVSNAVVHCVKTNIMIIK